jgi:RNA polymerase sigma-70 factor (ECF subfamily)
MNIADLDPGVRISGFPVRSSQILATDADAEFSALVQRQSQFVFRVAYAVLLNSFDAEDAVQETFLKLYRNSGWKDAENERAYLARVAWRIAVDHKRRSSASAVAGSADPMALDRMASSDPEPDERIAEANQRAFIHVLIDSLAEELRVPLVLSAFEELNSREIGKILGVPEGTVRTRLQKARQMLRQKLASSKEVHCA